MKKKMMQRMMGSCKDATFNVSRQEEGVLSIGKRIQLWIHLRFCEVCRKFVKQSNKIHIASKVDNKDDSLSPEARKRIKDMIGKTS